MTWRGQPIITFSSELDSDENASPFMNKPSVIVVALGLLLFLSHTSLVVGKRVVVAGATGYIGRAVVRDLVQRGVPTTSLVRTETEITGLTAKYLEGSEILRCEASDRVSIEKALQDVSPDAVICCLASRSGVVRDSWAVDYQASLNVLNALQDLRKKDSQFVLLSAYCCGKPLLQFQFAKLKLEEEIRKSHVSHSIVRPTAYFKSLDGQLENVRKGNQIVYFGDGTCAANAISDRDLASFLVDCALKPRAIGMLDQTRNLGGPDVPPIPKREQGMLIYETLNVPAEKRNFVSVPVGLLDGVIGTFAALETLFRALRLESLTTRFEDAAEIARIVKYYATEPMVATGPGEVYGTMTLRDHFEAIAQRGGKLEEVDKMTTTAGVLEVFAKNDFATTQVKAGS